jgi:hypothetical protein
MNQSLCASAVLLRQLAVWLALTCWLGPPFRRRLIKEFERDGRMDGMLARELADRKRNLVTELNSFIALKKSYTTTEQGRGELMEGAASPEPQCVYEGEALDSPHLAAR